MKNAPTLHRFEYLAFLCFMLTVRIVPHRAARSIGRLLGRILFTFSRSRRKLTLSNLAHAFPDQSLDKRRRVARRSFAEMACSFTDAVSSARFDAVEICGRLELDGWEHLEQAEREGKGTIILGAHIGVWEIISQVVALYKGPVSIVGRPLDNPFLDRFVAHNRSRFGNILAGKRGAARAMLRALKAGGRTAILIDQRVQPKEGIPIPFFGRPASTSPIVARLSLKTGAPVVPVYAFAASNGRYRIKVHPPIFPDGSGNDPVRTLTCRYMDGLERVIRKDPAQWLWMHNRWK